MSGPTGPGDARRSSLRVVTAAVGLHAAVSLGHGLTHLEIPVPLAVWQQGFVGVVGLALPLSGCWLAWQGSRRRGGVAVCLGGLGSVAFGTYFHFVAANPDNVAAVTGPWSGHFSVTAVGVSLLALATAVAGGWLLRQSPAQGRSRRSPGDRMR